MRVLLLCEFATLNGGEHSMLSTLDRIRCGGFELIAVAPKSGPMADAFSSHGIKVCPIDFTDALGTRCTLHERRMSLTDIIRRIQPALVHANSLSMSRLLGPVASAMKIPSLGHLRDIVKLSRQAIDDLNMLERRIAVSEAVRSFHIKQGMNVNDTVTLHNGVDLTQFRPRTRCGFLHRELQLPPSDRLIGTAGQIALRKGHDVMARAMKTVAGFAADAHWVIVGDRYSDKLESRQYEAALRELANSGVLAGRIHFLGYRSDIAKIYGELTMLVHSARQEPLGRVLLEAGASGLPIVATDVGGTREIYPSELHAAWLVPPDDVDATVQAMTTILGDEERAAKMGIAARKRIEAAFDLRIAAERLVQHYRELLRLAESDPNFKSEI